MTTDTATRNVFAAFDQGDDAFAAACDNLDSARMAEEVNLPHVDMYGEDGITIGLTSNYDICEVDDFDAVVTVSGHALYCCSLDEAKRSIRNAYMHRTDGMIEFAPGLYA